MAVLCLCQPRLRFFMHVLCAISQLLVWTLLLWLQMKCVVKHFRLSILILPPRFSHLRVPIGYDFIEFKCRILERRRDRAAKPSPHLFGSSWWSIAFLAVDQRSWQFYPTGACATTYCWSAKVRSSHSLSISRLAFLFHSVSKNLLHYDNGFCLLPPPPRSMLFCCYLQDSWLCSKNLIYTAYDVLPASPTNLWSHSESFHFRIQLKPWSKSLG